MTVSMTKSQIRKICNQNETDLLEKTFSKELKTLSEDELQKEMIRSRALRDKYRDLYRRQVRAANKTTGKLPEAISPSENTRIKAELFSSAVTVFRDQLKSVKAPHAKSVKKPQSKDSKKGVGKANIILPSGNSEQPENIKNTAPAAEKPNNITKEQTHMNITNSNHTLPQNSSGNFLSPETQHKAIKHDFKKANLKPIQGHIKSAGKKSQAKRDSR